MENLLALFQGRRILVGRASSVFAAGKHGGVGAMTVGWDKLLIVIIAFAVLTFTKINPAYIILAATVVGVTIY